MLHFRHMIMAVDVGGTKTLVASFATTRHIANEERFPTPADSSDFLSQLAQYLDRFDASNAEAICVAVPGLISPDGTVLRCGHLPWVNFQLRKLLAKKYSCPIFINNDAKLAGLAETHNLPEVPPLSLYITLSTGIGTGIIVNGRLEPALANSEGGHMVLQTPQGPQIWENFASGHAIHQHFKRNAADIHTASDWHEIADKLALGFQAIIPLLQPQVIIIGGSVGSYFDRYGHLLKEVLRHRLPAYINLPIIKQAAHPQEAVLYGCYYYAVHQRITSPAS